MRRPKSIKIEFYIPTKNKDGEKLEPAKIDAIVLSIWPKFKGATILAGTGYYRPDLDTNEEADCYVLSIVTEYNRSTIEQDLTHFKEAIKTDLNQNKVLITWHYLEEVL